MNILTHIYPLASLHLTQPLPLTMMLIIIVVFFAVLVSNRMIAVRVRKRKKKAEATTTMLQNAVEISGNNVVRYDLRDRYVYKLYGAMFPDERISAKEWKRHVHPDDLEDSLDWLHQVMDGGLKRAEFNYRWNFDFTGTAPRWGYMHNVSVPEYLQGTRRVINLISTVSDETELRQREERENELSGKYRLIFEHSIIGLSFYTPDGWLLDSNKMMREICHFDSDKHDAFFSKNNLFELSPFRECCNPDHIEELWICHQSIVPERDLHDYLETRLHPILDDNGQVVYIAVATRNVTEERELYLQSKLNDQQIQQANEKIRAYEEELSFMMEACDMRAWRVDYKAGKVQFMKGLSTVECELTVDEYLQYFIDDGELVANYFKEPEKHFSKPLSVLRKMHPIFHETEQEIWNQVNSVPIFDADGQLVGSFGLIRNLTRFIRAQEQLKKETQRANESGRLKSVFLANMTHEIRTPLNAIVGFSDLLQAVESPDDKKEMIRVIHNNCDMLLRLINDILVLSNLDANAMQLVPAKVDFSREFDLTCQSLQQRVQEPGVVFQKDNPLPSLVIHIDIGRIQQVITNFVTNAVKYTHQGHIRVGYRLEDNSQLYVYCEDTGTGIPKEKQEAVFERFVKLNDYIQGTGLGLSICKAIVEKCGGHIGLDSEVGKGSTFWFRIPVEILSQ